MKFEQGWLLRQLEQTSKTYNSWPKWLQDRYRFEKTTELIDDLTYQMRREDSKKYGNY